ncbi:hypothetical protein CABS03_02941 [Colletotrichum abscissum]|uniref:Uncharacterized protein n=1 Tax=Colletotrichum abscissum TaxID=1671311 RepID=A0A9P9XKR4_9PEZI|nr:hypothetical protein CABS02_04267 [Colletotrichum abscissum]
MDYSSITCFLSIPATLSAHPYPFLQRVLAGGVTFIRQTGPTNDSSNSRHYQGSGIVRYGGAWRGSLFPWFPARKKKSATAPYPWPLLLIAGLPLVTSLSQLPPGHSSSTRSDTPVDSPFASHCTLCTLCSLSHLSHTATATSMQHLPVAPWHRGPLQILGRLFLCDLLTVPVYFGGFLLLLNILNWIQDTTCHKVQTAHSHTSPFIPRQSSHGPSSSASHPP